MRKSGVSNSEEPARSSPALPLPRYFKPLRAETC
jgi:hypothetical protein